MPFGAPVNELLAVLLAVSAGLLAWLVVWQKGIVPVYRTTKRLVRGIDRIADATPVLISIAEEFQPNGGHSLRDAVDGKADKADVQRIEDGVLEAIRIGKASMETVIESSDQLTAHLALVSWASERTEVLERLDRIEARLRIGRSD